MENGQVVQDHQGNPVRNFSFLPRYISVRPSGWLIEFWMRSDTRLTYRDIKARMSAPTEELPSDNVLNMRRERDARKPLGLSCWTARRGGVTKAEIERIEQLSPENVAYNTALKVYRGFDVPMLESKSFYPNTTPHYYPVNAFLDSGETTHSPGPRLESCIQLLFDLQVLATETGLDDWRHLPEDKLPAWWIKTKAKGDTEQAGPAISTPKSAPRTRMSWKTPRKPATSTVAKAQTPAGVMTPENTPNGLTPASVSVSQNNPMGFTGHSQHYNSPVYNMTTGNGMINSPSPFNGYQSVPWSGSQQLQSSPFSDFSLQSSEVDMMMLDDSPIRFPIQEQTHFALAAVTGVQGSVNDYLGFEDPFVDDFALSGNVNYNSFLGDIATQVYQHNQAGVNQSGLNPQEAGMYRFNGYSGFSIRENQGHKLNINTNEIMERSNPFSMLQGFDPKQPMSPKRSFEEFLMGDISI